MAGGRASTGMKLVNCYHIKKKKKEKTPLVAIGNVKHLLSSGRSALTLIIIAMCLLIAASDFQQQIANHYAQRGGSSSSRSGSGGSSYLLLLAEANVDANRLYEDLMMTYNRIVLPVENNTDRVVVKLSLKLSQLIDVNLKNQMMTTNVWLNQEWSDYKLKWDPSEYGGIQDINVPAEQIWLPDIVLYNSAEGYFAVSIMTKAKVRYDGHVTWNPPAIFRSSCQIDITYFPFDSQNCHLKFGSWTFGTKIDLRHINDTEIIERGTDLSEYYQNVEWDIMQASARRNVITYTCCPNDFYPDVTFNFTLRRKPLFYTVNLILPCIGITILSFLVFYLPSDSGEKVTLTISILVSLIFFLSVLIETIPSTSLAMPLLGKYLVFTMILITLSVCATVCVLNIHFRTPSTHSMPSWVKRWCIDILPRYLFMNVPQYQSAQSSVLPEQLVYVYNQAYAKAPPQPPTAAPQSAQQPPLAQANKSSAGTSHSQTANHLSALNHPPGDAAMHQLDPRSLQQQVDPNLRPLNNSPASLFLPYLQSEAARRLKLQRSRSSERDRSTSDGNQNTTSHLINNNNNDCDKHEWASKTTTPNTGFQRRNSETHGENSAATKRSTASKQVKAKRSSRRKSVRGEQTKGSWLSHLFSSSKRNNKVSGVAEDYEAARGVSRSEDRSKRGGRQVVLPRQDTSSSVEYDYQHHNHFQARASICSNNMWRVGPSRRCSTAVPVNYPTYYQPLVHLVQRPPPQQQPAEQQQPLTTLSGCISQGHLHSLQQTSVKSTELGNESGGFESKQQQHKQVVHKAQEVRQQQTLPNQQQPVPYLSSVQHPHAVYQRQQQVSDLMPTPPPPLPPSGSTLHQFHLNQDHQHHQRQILMSNDNQQRVAPEAIFGMLSNNSQLLQQSKQSHSNQRARLVGAQESSYWSVTPGSSMEPNIGSTINTINNNNNTLNFNQPSGQINSSNQIGYHVVETGEQQGLSRAQPVHNQFHLVASSSNPNHLQQSRVIQYMPRSRSTDHRLCSHLREQIYMDRSQQQVAAAHELQQQPQVLNRSHVPPTLLRALPVQRTLINQSHLGAQQHHTIGRALGQAYMQRLQRQPTIYSLGANIQRPSRSVHRGTNEHHQQQQPYLAGDLVHQLSVNHQMPRSRSQSSLDRRPRLNTGAAADCQQCNYSAIHRTTSRIQLAQLADTDCSFGVTRTQCPGNQSCAQTGGVGSFRYNSTDSKTCCAGNSGCSSDTCRLTAERCDESRNCTRGGPMDHREGAGSGRCGKHSSSTSQSRQPAPLTNLGLMKLISDVDKAIQNAMFIAQHIDNLDEFESVKENWKYIAMVIDRIFLIVFLIACIGGTVAIFGMVPWENYTVAKPIDLQLTRLMALNLTGTGEQYSRSCRDF